MDPGSASAQIEKTLLGFLEPIQQHLLLFTEAQLGLLAKNEQYEQMADDYNLMDCFECGSCSYVCPAHIPLVQRFRGAKAMARKLGAGS